MAKRKRKEYDPWETPYYRQMNRGVDKMFGKDPDDSDKSHWIIVFLIFMIFGFIMAAIKSQ